jgi:hypothetical protein
MFSSLLVTLPVPLQSSYRQLWAKVERGRKGKEFE